MVWFQCEDCGDNLKKPKLASHFNSCSASKLSCIDCGVVFDKRTVQAHTSCISEVEKYGPKGDGKVSTGKPANGVQKKPIDDGTDISVGLSTHPPWKCSLCNVNVTSQENLQLHAEGKKHRAKARTAARKEAENQEAALKDSNSSREEGVAVLSNAQAEAEPLATEKSEQSKSGWDEQENSQKLEKPEKSKKRTRHEEKGGVEAGELKKTMEETEAQEADAAEENVEEEKKKKKKKKKKKGVKKAGGRDDQAGEALSMDGKKGDASISRVAEGSGSKEEDETKRSTQKEVAGNAAVNDIMKKGEEHDVGVKASMADGGDRSTPQQTSKRKKKRKKPSSDEVEKEGEHNGKTQQERPDKNTHKEERGYVDAAAKQKKGDSSSAKGGHTEQENETTVNQLQENVEPEKEKGKKRRRKGGDGKVKVEEASPEQQRSENGAAKRALADENANGSGVEECPSLLSKVKWHNVLKKAFKHAPDGELSLKKLLKLALPLALQHTGEGANQEDLRSEMSKQIHRSRQYAVEGTKVHIVSK